MAYQSLDIGTSADDGTGDSLRVGGDKINDNFSEIYTLLGTGSTLTTGLSTTASVVTLSSAVGTFTTLTPAAADGTALGSAALEWSDLFLADGAVINFGDDQDVTLTHSADSGLILGRTSTADDAFPIFSLATGDNDIAAGDKLGQINWFAPNEGAGTDAIVAAASIFVAAEGNFSSSNNASTMFFSTSTSGTPTERMKITSGGNIVFPTDGVVLSLGADNEVTLTHSPDSGLILGRTSTADDAFSTLTISTGDDTIVAGDKLGQINWSAPNETGTDAIAVAASIFVAADGTFDASNNATTMYFSTSLSGTPTERMKITSGGNIVFPTDGNTFSFGANSEVILTHVHDTGLLLNAAMEIQFRDSAISIGSTADGDLSIAADDEIDITSTLIDINGNLDVSGTIVAAGALTAATSITVGSAVLTEAELELLDGLTAGTAIASKVVTTDSSIDTTGQRNLTISGELDAATLDISGNVDISGTALITGVTTHGDDVVSDTDSTDDLGTTSVRWANLFVDAITATDQITATGFTGTLDGILGSGAAAAASVTTLTATGTVTMTGKAINHAVHTEAAHATTSNIWSGGNTCLLSGSVVTFTDVADAPQAGAVRFVVANAAHIITDNAALEVDGNENYTCAVNDVLMFTAKTTSTFRVSVIAHGDNATGGGGGESGFVENNATISADVSIVSGNNAISAGPVTVANGVTLTIPNGSRYVIV